MEYPYFAQVKRASKKKITDTISIRDWLEIEINDQAVHTLLYILMNPSKADRIECDDTVKKLLDFTRKQTERPGSIIPGVRNIIIVNLFPFYKTDSNELYQVLEELEFTRNGYQDLMKANLLKIRKGIQEAEYIVFGWGDPPKNVDEWYHRELTSSILKHVKKCQKENMYVFTSNREKIITKKRHPRHPIIISLTGLQRCEIKHLYTIHV